MLERVDLKELPQAFGVYPPSSIVSYFIGAFLHRDEHVRWKAVYAFGLTVAKIAEAEMERARIIIRRLMWMLNEESGGMGWGVGEGYAEALFHSEKLKNEYLQLYLSYLWPEGNYLEFPPAQRGFAWGIGRLAQRYEEEVIKLSGHEYLVLHLSSEDPTVSFLSLWSLMQFKSLRKSLKKEDYFEALERLKHLDWKVLLFDGKTIKTYTPQDLESLVF
ncbi:MAG: DVU0298 family protein [Thermodesulfobacteriaceae bacterium]